MLLLKFLRMSAKLNTCLNSRMSILQLCFMLLVLSCFQKMFAYQLQSYQKVLLQWSKFQSVIHQAPYHRLPEIQQKQILMGWLTSSHVNIWQNRGITVTFHYQEQSMIILRNVVLN